MTIGVIRGRSVVVDYDTSWVQHFREECERVSPYVSATIEHIGSTSIPGIPAKPIIDMLIGYKTEAEKKAICSSLVKLGYLDRGCTHDADDHIFILVDCNQVQTHKFHLVEQKLSRKFPESRPEYTNSKDPFIKSVLKLASTPQESR